MRTSAPWPLSRSGCSRPKTRSIRSATRCAIRRRSCEAAPSKRSGSSAIARPHQPWPKRPRIAARSSPRSSPTTKNGRSRRTSRCAGCRCSRSCVCAISTRSRASRRTSRASPCRGGGLSRMRSSESAMRERRRPCSRWRRAPAFTHPHSPFVVWPPPKTRASCRSPRRSPRVPMRMSVSASRPSVRSDRLAEPKSFRRC